VTLRTLGAVTWEFSGNVPEPQRSEIADSMNYLANLYSTVSTFSFRIVAAYSGSPGLTAQSGYTTLITFGTQRDARAALHESGHFLGVGRIGQWTSRMVNGVWQGTEAQRRVKAFDGPTAEVHGDTQHFWPYGMNNGSEFGPRRATRSVYMFGALRADMGLSGNGQGPSDGTAGTPGVFRLVNRQSGLLLQDAQLSEGGAVAQTVSNTSVSQKWTLSFDNGHITLTNGASQRYLGSINGAAQMLTVPTGAQHWEMAVTDSGYFRLFDPISNLCLLGVAGPMSSASTVVGMCSTTATDTTDQWHLAD
jgi:hypothetical protein